MHQFSDDPVRFLRILRLFHGHDEGHGAGADNCRPIFVALIKRRMNPQFRQIF
jgi:hypothetical protein